VSATGAMHTQRTRRQYQYPPGGAVAGGATGAARNGEGAGGLAAAHGGGTPAGAGGAVARGPGAVLGVRKNLADARRVGVVNNLHVLARHPEPLPVAA